MPISVTPAQPTTGTIVALQWSPTKGAAPSRATYIWSVNHGVIYGEEGRPDTNRNDVYWDTAGVTGVDCRIEITVQVPDRSDIEEIRTVYVAAGTAIQQRPLETLTKLERSASPPSPDQVFWPFIRNRTQAIGFQRYSDYLDELARQLLRPGEEPVGEVRRSLPSTLPRPLGGKHVDPACALSHGTYGYELLRLATDVFLIFQCGTDGENSDRFDDALIVLDGESGRLGQRVTLPILEQKLRDYLGAGERLPYLDRILRALFGERLDDELALSRYHRLLECRAHCPALLELIWSYWHEEGMLAQSMNAIALRFQNKSRGGRDPLARLEIDPLRPLNNLLWGYIQSSYKRLTVLRRAYEYDHHYGLTLQGKAIPPLKTADSRSKFLETFHNLLGKTAAFYAADADTTVVADAFPILNALKDLHLVLAEGAHNQFGDLPWTARVEMLIEQWLLARPEMREFLGGRVMVPYAEPWMGQVDTMKKLQEWNPTSITHFRDLGVFGEQILLSVRYGDWSGVVDEAQAKNWARYWKPEVQGYVHAYRAVTAVDLATEPASEADVQRRRALPAALILQRLSAPASKMPVRV